jgi:hypothetical protein
LKQAWIMPSLPAREAAAAGWLAKAVVSAIASSAVIATAVSLIDRALPKSAA